MTVRKAFMFPGADNILTMSKEVNQDGLLKMSLLRINIISRCGLGWSTLSLLTTYHCTPPENSACEVYLVFQIKHKLEETITDELRIH